MAFRPNKGIKEARLKGCSIEEGGSLFNFSKRPYRPNRRDGRDEPDRRDQPNQRNQRDKPDQRDQPNQRDFFLTTFLPLCYQAVPVWRPYPKHPSEEGPEAQRR